MLRAARIVLLVVGLSLLVGGLAYGLLGGPLEVARRIELLAALGCLLSVALGPFERARAESPDEDDDPKED